MRRVLLLLVLMPGPFVRPGTSEWEFVDWNGGDSSRDIPFYVEPLTDPGDEIFRVMCDGSAHAGKPGDIWDADVH